jgi:hypothetical protein
MLVYYFTSPEYGLSNLKNKHLKVSEFKNLNDPFEFLGVEMSDKDVRKALNFEKSLISKSKGLICFSESKYDPVQWAHYADNHKGVCLGFEIPKKKLSKVKYVSSRLAKSTIDDPGKAHKLLTTKFKHWKYEKEHRLVLDIANRKRVNGLIFENFSKELSLREIYIGFRSKIAFRNIKNVYKSEGKDVIVKYTRPAFRDFRIVWDRKKKSLRV